MLFDENERHINLDDRIAREKAKQLIYNIVKKIVDDGSSNN